MKKLKLLSIAIFLMAYVQAFSDTVWTFDCDSELWGVDCHLNAFNMEFSAADTTVNSAHIKLTHKLGATTNWFFSTLQDTIDADVEKHLHFSLTLTNAGSIPPTGIDALLVWQDATSTLRTKSFKIFSGHNNYHIDLSSEANWTGQVMINRIHFPQSDETANGYTPATAVYALDWIAVSSSSSFTPTAQDNSSECNCNTLPIISNTNTVVFGNRVSMKTTVNSSLLASAKMKCWKVGGDTITSEQVVSVQTEVYFSFYDLDSAANYQWQLEVSNDGGTAFSSTQSFVTEDTKSEDMPTNYWMTPTPFILTQNPNDHLLDDDTWSEAAGLAQVFKIHGATTKGSGLNTQFYRYDYPKLIYTINKHRMRMAIEKLIDGDRSGQEYANQIIDLIEGIAKCGGKLEFLTWDGMMFRNFYSTATSSSFRTADEGLEAVAEATKIINNSYPDFEIIPLPNLPNWDIKDENGNIVSHNAGDWAGATGVTSWDYLCDIYLDKIAQKGVSINYIEIDHPYNYYIKDGGRAVSAQRINAMKHYCDTNNLELINIINTSGLSSGQDAQFKQECLTYLDYLKADGIPATYVDLESWYPYPDYLTPETRDGSFTNTVRDVGRAFFNNDTVYGWEFTTGDEGWNLNPNNLNLSASNGHLDCSPTGGADPYVYNTTSPSFATTDFNYLDVRVKNGTSSIQGSIYIWTTTVGPLVVPIPMTANSQDYEKVVVDLSTVPNYSNNLTVTNVRIDPNNGGETGVVSYDYIRFEGLYPDTTLVQEITIQGATSVEVGQTAQMSVDISPQYPTNSDVTYSVDDSSIATIDANTGLLTAISVGTVNVTATAQDGSGVTDSISVQVTAIPIITIGWEFTTGDEGWTNNPHNLTVSASNGNLDCSPTGSADPYVYNTTSPTFTTTDINYLEVRVKNSTSATVGHIYLWTTTVPVFFVPIPMTANSPDYETVIVDLSTVSNWSNSLSVTNMRIDPNGGGQTGVVSYDYIRFVSDTNINKNAIIDYSMISSWGESAAINEVQNSISNNIQDENRPSIYPNPAKNRVHIAVREASIVYVYNINGQMIYSNKVQAGLLEIDVSSWKSGMYLVKIKCADKISNHKLIVK